MKRILTTALLLALVLPAGAQRFRGMGLGAGMFGGSTNQHVTVTIKADGTAEIRNDSVLLRAQLEQQVRMMEYYRKMQAAAEEDAGDDDEQPRKRPQPPEAKPYADDELAKAMRSPFDHTQEQDGEETTSMKLDDVQISKDTVRVVYTTSLKTLEDLVQQDYSIWSAIGMYFEETKFEKDAEGRLKLTLKPHEGWAAKDYVKEMHRALKLTGARSALTLVFPGKVISSPFPVTKDNTTSLVLDAAQKDSVEAAAKALAAPAPIIAEAGGLNLAAAVSSTTARRSRRQQQAGPYDALPLADAATGYAGEPSMVTVVTAQVFPGAEERLKRSRAAHELYSTGMVVQAKLFLPKGRTLLASSQPRVLKAVDNTGRDLAMKAAGEADAEMHEMMMMGHSSGREGSTVPLQLRLQLPSPDAQTIEEVQIETIVTTTGKWKQMTLTNVQVAADKPIDLGEILPGAKLAITKFTSKRGQQNLQGTITGPPTIRQLDLKFTPANKDRGDSSAYDRNYKVKDGQATRTIQVTAYSYDAEDRKDNTPPPPLVIRIPEDPKRERVKVTLKGLDLF